jgi:alcohol dehydrogenase (cytochrome c)
MGKWRGRPADELLTLMRETMPPRGTGTVDPQVFPGLLDFLVKANVDGVPAIATVTPPPVRPAGASEPAPARLAPELAQLMSSLTPVTEAVLAAPPDSDWLMWRRTFDAAGFSPLRQIDRDNVRRLQKSWSLPLDPSTNEITPLVHDGVLFVYSGASLQAVDAGSGRPLWKYTHPSAGAAAGAAQYAAGQRGRLKSIAIHGHALFMPTPDGHLLALDARSGRLLWERAISGDGFSSGLTLSSGPLVARGVVIIGASLGLTNKGGCFILGLDAATGEERWRFHTIARPGTPGGDSWNGAPVGERFGGGVWTTGSYDPLLNLVYFGIGNTYTTATLLQPRPGSPGVTANDGLYTNATVALRPETGELVWHHQHHRRDVWDQDWAFEQTLVTLGRGAIARRVLVTGGKTGVFEAVDAATGAFLFAMDTGLTNLFTAIDQRTGEKRTNPELEPVAGKTLFLCPSNLGARNWPATSLDAATGVLFVPMTESCADFTYEPRSPAETASGGSDIRFSPRFRPDSDGNFGRVTALDLDGRRVRWTHRQRMPVAGSLLATAGGLLFMGDLGRNFGAYDQQTGALLWQTRLPAAAESNPITYAVGGRQYVAVVSGEGSHLGINNRRLVVELGTPKTELELIVFALPGD